MNMQTADGYAKDRFFVRLPMSAPFIKNAKIDNNLIDKKREEIIFDKFRSYYLELKINPKNAKRIVISFDDGNSSCVAELDFENKRVQINDAPRENFAPKLQTVIEYMKKCDKKGYFKEKCDDYTPQNAKNYAIAYVDGMDKEFTFRAVIRYSKKNEKHSYRCRNSRVYNVYFGSQ